MAPVEPISAGSVLSQCDNHATSTARQEPATQQWSAESMIPDDDSIKRFVVVAVRGHYYKVFFFDKERQTDPIEQSDVAMEPGSMQLIGALTTAWLQTGVLISL